jgi:hypothetical protein
MRNHKSIKKKSTFWGGQMLDSRINELDFLEEHKSKKLQERMNKLVNEKQKNGS